MSSDEEALAIGRIVQEYRSLKSKLPAIRSELERIGRVLEAMGATLKHGKPSKEIFRQENLFAMDVDKIFSLIDEFESTSERVETLKEQMKELGIPD